MFDVFTGSNTSTKSVAKEDPGDTCVTSSYVSPLPHHYPVKKAPVCTGSRCDIIEFKSHKVQKTHDQLPQVEGLGVIYVHSPPKSPQLVFICSRNRSCIICWWWYAITTITAATLFMPPS